MAKKTWDNPIDKTIPWDGNKDTDNLPVRGSRVEEFIKNTFDEKMGVLHYDVSNNRYLVFADSITRDAYLDDPMQTNLILGTFDAPFNYTAEINLLSPAYNAIFVGSTGNYIDFTFDIKNKNGASTGENVNVTYTFIRNANKKVINETRRYGEIVHFNVDEYIETGTNTIIISITGQSTLAATTVALTYQVVDLRLSDELDISKVYNLTNGSVVADVFFSVSGYGTKTVEWFLDGEQLPFVKSEDEVIDMSSERTKYITLSNLATGIHTLQFRAYTLINGEKFYTDTLYRELIIHNGEVDNNALAIATTLPAHHGIVREDNPLSFYGAEQYLPYGIRFATRKSVNVSIYLGDDLLSTITTSSGRESEYSIVSNKAGTLALRFVIGNTERKIPFVIANTSLNIEEITTSLSFDFTARGRSNSSIDKDVWAYGEYTGTFVGFNWNATSGWVNNALLINSGASFSVDIAPLASDATSSGKTLEFEFATRNVEKDDAVVCDLRGENGAGLLITASEARLVSVAGEVVSTKFKSGEVNRIAFVVNRKTSVTYKGLAFIYVNGIISGAINVGSADNFVSSRTLSFVGSNDAHVELRAMRFYNEALSSENILNNFTLYRDTLNEMLEVYYRNDIYEDGTTTFSPDKAQHRLPVMIVTGDIPTLEEATSTSTQITVDVSYVNEQKPSYSFTMKNAAMRIQGTSSLAYPRKNFRIYTTKVDSTIVYDAEGKIVEDKLYSFKDGAQPVDCWCLKADYAESSGTHNTGIARIWNEVMYNAQIQYKNVLGEEVNGYALRTKAQEAALAAGYPYDVRTTIDGFPILLFYKRNANDTNLVFLGKYNFNNDKATPSVFGFEGIPEFDNSKMQCWETKDNGHPLGLFTDISNFDANWSEAYESRYPDTSNPDTSYLKAFSVWVNGVSQENFITEKWAHLDVYKVAAYYVYLMRFGAVDQVVKNGFITSEDGEHFFYINYDNDTINGLINTGELRLDPEINRQTIGSDGEYVYAGHDSVLWNLLEADGEFMDIVKVVDNALYSAGLRYDLSIDMFNDEQASKWVERVYNQDAEYKYLLPFANAGTNNLFMLQGSRSSHRSWWLSKRFSLYDSLFVSGNYRDRNISFKCLNNTQPAQRFTITAGSPMDYGYGVNNGIREVGVSLKKDESHTFITTDTLNLGDVVKIFGAANISSLNLSSLASRLAVLDVSASNDPALGTKLKELILGNADGQTNTELSSISGLNVLTSLQTLNVENYKSINSLDLTSQVDFRKLYAIGSNLSSVDFAKGALVERLELPASMLALNLEELPYLTYNNLILEDKKQVSSITIKNCPNISEIFSFFNDWYVSKTAENKDCSLVVDNIKWVNISASEFVRLLNIKKDGGTLDLKGYVKFSNISKDAVYSIISILGEDVFYKNSDLFIETPTAIYLDADATEMYEGEGESVQFSARVIPNKAGIIKYSTDTPLTTYIDEDSGLFTATEAGYERIVVVYATFTPADGSAELKTSRNIRVKKRVYPSNVTIQGKVNIAINNGVYTWTTPTTNINGYMVVEWLLTGDIAAVATIASQDDNKCVVAINSPVDDIVDGYINLYIKKRDDGSHVASASMEIQALPSNVVLTSKTNKGVQASLYNAGLVVNEHYSFLSEVKSITETQLQPGSSSSPSIFYANRGDIKNFSEFKYFTRLKEVPPRLFSRFDVDTIELPNTITTIGSYAFESAKIATFRLIQSVTKIESFAFVRGSIQNLHIEDLSKFFNIDIKNIEDNPMYNASKVYAGDEHITTLNIPAGVTKLKDYAICAPNSDIDSVYIPNSVTSIGYRSIELDNTTFKLLYGGENVINISRESLYNNYAIKYPNLQISDTIPFAITYHNNGELLIMGNQQGSNSLMSFLLGQFTVKTLSGVYFDDMTTTRTINLNWTGKVEDLTERLKVGYVTLNISSNKPEAEFKVEYTNFDGESVTTIVKGAGSHYLPIKYNSYVYVSGYTEYDYYEAKRVTLNGWTQSNNSVSCDYTSKLGAYIHHIDGTLYTPSAWTSKGFTNDEANAIAVLSEEVSFAIAKEDVEGEYEWGAALEIDDFDFEPIPNEADAAMDFGGLDNTAAMAWGLNGKTDSYGVAGAPAALAAVQYVFPNGDNGYLGSYGQWVMVKNNLSDINECLAIVGGESIELNTSNIYWTSTQQSVAVAYPISFIAMVKRSKFKVRSLLQNFTFKYD